ncbi:hypothetical protein IWQ60_003523 [Tieghemiomyces parasiticus]|uniref:Methylosome subunit pICln n=1 Tax=Tieghemiomyces parasiticus TaxID=78921 RepID=A0A9W8ACQ3_9FUNG|nr:hypothetical protein IWQ60_003523 [Tieghemiomyces parasiticus]
MARVLTALPRLEPTSTEGALTLRHKVSPVTCTVKSEGGDIGLDNGDLYVTEEEVIFFNPRRSLGVSLAYRNIILHAATEQAGSTPNQPCLYLQTDVPLLNIDRLASPAVPSSADAQNEPVVTKSDSSDDEEDDDFDPIGAEFYLTPQDPGQLHGIFESVSTCANLHPDYEAVSDSDGLVDEDGFDPNEV